MSLKNKRRHHTLNSQTEKIFLSDRLTHRVEYKYQHLRSSIILIIRKRFCYKIIDQVLIIFIGKFLIPWWFQQQYKNCSANFKNSSKKRFKSWSSIHVSQNRQMKKVAFIPLRKIVSVFGFGQNNENDITSYFSYITVWWYSRVLISNECNMLHRQCIYIKRGMLPSDKNFCFPITSLFDNK